MRVLRDPDCLLSEGLASIRAQFRVPESFPAEVLAEAEAAASRVPREHRDRTAEHFVTLDPESSADLDQAFALEPAGLDWRLHYAIADVPWFVDDDSALDREAWARGMTAYLPGAKAGLYPPVLAEGAASLLADGPRPAVVFTTRIAPDGSVRLEQIERAVIRSRAKLGYESVRDDQLPRGFVEVAERIHFAELERGAARVDPPEQEVERDAGGKFRLHFRPLAPAETHNAALSLATNLAVAELLQGHRTGLFRVMAEPDERAIGRLRHTARAFGLTWPSEAPIAQFEKSLDQTDPRHAAFMLAVRRAGQGAHYAPFRDSEVPWHAAVAATYCHTTAPLRRLADRYVIRAALAVANGQAVPGAVSAAFERLPAVMDKAEARSSQIERAVVDLAEAAILANRVGERFAAQVTDVDVRGGGWLARIQLCDLPVVARISADNVVPGKRIEVRLDGVDMERRSLRFRRLM
jgi:exoribonuclease R